MSAAPTIPPLAEKVHVLYGPPGKPDKIAEHVVTTLRSAPSVVTVGVPGQEIAVVVTPAGINIARTSTPESVAGKSRLITWAQARQFVASGELSAVRYALTLDGTLFDIFPTKTAALDKAADLDGECHVFAVGEQFAAKHLR